MKVLVTGASGRIGRTIHARLARDGEVVGLDRQPSPTADVVADLRDTDALRAALRGVAAVVHTAALHAPQVGHCREAEFHAVNVEATRALAQCAAEAGVRRFVFTSTTALYGTASSRPDAAAWIDEATLPQPRTVYHHTKLEAEQGLEAFAADSGLAVTVLRMSRCFPEPAPEMAVYRLHRGIDARDVAEAHALALRSAAPGFRRFVISGGTPFEPGDLHELRHDAPAVLRRRAPALVQAFDARRWPLPVSIDRVYVPAHAVQVLGWAPRFGFEAVLAGSDHGSRDVLAGAPAEGCCA